jgi:hypothetical protein
MRRIAFVCAIGAMCVGSPLLEGCGDPQARAKAMVACFDADDAADVQFSKASQDQQLDAAKSPGELHDALTKALEACRPVVPMFSVDSSNQKLAEASKICKAAYRLKIQSFQNVLNGVYDNATLVALYEGKDLVIQCKAAGRAIGGLSG